MAGSKKAEQRRGRVNKVARRTVTGSTRVTLRQDTAFTNMVLVSKGTEVDYHRVDLPDGGILHVATIYIHGRPYRAIKLRGKR